ncbi:helicase-associated domain-containing protein [Paenibacillus filicis]|uniref:Helicase-associated domain-containing protein n=1 Tax=Paenibacillus filicis TaxID=669464 RepID=A0ABU9DSS8_9BACL
MKYPQLAALMPQELRIRLEGEPVYAAWLREGKTLEQAWQDDVVLETVYNRLNRAERVILDIIVRRIGCSPFDDTRLDRAAEARLSGAEIRSGLAGLRRKGLVFAFRKSWGELMYLLPEDGFARWQRILFASLSGPPNQTEKVEELQDGFDPVLPLFDVLVYAAKHKLKLTKQGTLPKRIVQQVAELASWDERSFGGISLKYAYADAYPLRVALVLDMALKLKLLSRQEDELRLEPEALHTFLFLSRAEQNKQLYAWWKDIAFPSEVWLQHAALLVEAWPASAALQASQIVTSFVRVGLLDLAAEPLELRERVRLLQELWLEPLCGLGWLEKEMHIPIVPNANGMDHQSFVEYSYRWRRHPGEAGSYAAQELEEGRLLVQPDFDILVPPDVPLHVQWELGCLATEPLRDMLSVYKLTKDSMKHALENGRSADEVIAFLDAHAAYGVPENIRLALKQWAKPFGLTHVVSLTMLRCADAETARTVWRLPAAAKLLGELIGERDYIVDPVHVKTLASVLEKAGFIAGLKLQQADEQRDYPVLRQPEVMAFAEPEALELPSEVQGLVYARHSAGYFQMDAALPEPFELYPDLRDIPASWLKDYRNYHPSTRREIVEKAIQLRSLLQIRKAGEDCRIVPRKLQETRGSWCITGMEAESPGAEPRVAAEGEGRGRPAEIRLLEGEWQEMKLILPGVNDKY